MTPKEKAYSLLWEFLPMLEGWTDNTKTKLAAKCVKKLADEMFKVTAPACDRHEPYYLKLKDEQTQIFWIEVIKEMESLLQI